MYQFSSVAQSCLTLCDPMDCSTPGLPVHHQLLELAQTHVYIIYINVYKIYINIYSKNTGVGSHSLLQGIFSSQGLNQSLLHCRQIFYCLSHQGSPKNEPSTNQRTRHRRDVPIKALTGRQPGLKSVLYQQARTRP